MTGGIDKRVLTKSRKDIDKELERVMPIAEQGGYIPTLDHGIPDNVPYKNFIYYWERRKKMMGLD